MYKLKLALYKCDFTFAFWIKLALYKCDLTSAYNTLSFFGLRIKRFSPSLSLSLSKIKKTTGNRSPPFIFRARPISSSNTTCVRKICIFLLSALLYSFPFFFWKVGLPIVNWCFLCLIPENFLLCIIMGKKILESHYTITPANCLWLKNSKLHAVQKKIWNCRHLMKF